MPRIQISTLPCMEAVADGEMELKSFGQFNTKIHYHEKAQLLSPEMGVVYLYSEKGNFCLPAGHYAYISSGVNHKLVSRSQNLKLKTVFLDMSANQSKAFCRNGIAIFQPSSLLDNLLIFGKQHWFKKGNDDLRTSGLLYLKMVLPHILKTPLKLSIQPPQSELLLGVVEYIVSSLDEHIKISSIADFINISERTLFRLFKKETGMTIFQFIKLSRMQMALELLEDEELNINEIVYRVGYDSASTFSNLFKELLGTSPQKYRQNFLKKT